MSALSPERSGTARLDRGLRRSNPGPTASAHAASSSPIVNHKVGVQFSIGGWWPRTGAAHAQLSGQCARGCGPSVL